MSASYASTLLLLGTFDIKSYIYLGNTTVANFKLKLVVIIKLDLIYIMLLSPS